MNSKIIFVILGLVAITLINIIFKFIHYFLNYKIHKYGIKVHGIVVGYFVESKTVILDKSDYVTNFYPIVKFRDISGNEITAKIVNRSFFPIYKVGEQTTIRYYKIEEDNIIREKMYLNKFATKKEEVDIYTNVKLVFVDLKHNFDIILELFFIMLIAILNTMIKL